MYLCKRAEQVCVCLLTRSSSGDIGYGFVFLEAGPLSSRVVHLKHGVHQHGGAAGSVRFRQYFCVLAQFDLNDVTLLWTGVFCWEEGIDKH